MLSSFKTTFVTVNQNFPIDREEAYKNSKTTFVTVNLPIIVPPLSLSLIQKQLLLLLIGVQLIMQEVLADSKTTFVTVNLPRNTIRNWELENSKTTFVTVNQKSIK